jgi:hypothetical protein
MRDSQRRSAMTEHRVGLVQLRRPARGRSSRTPSSAAVGLQRESSVGRNSCSGGSSRRIVTGRSAISRKMPIEVLALHRQDLSRARRGALGRPPRGSSRAREDPALLEEHVLRFRQRARSPPRRRQSATRASGRRVWRLAPHAAAAASLSAHARIRFETPVERRLLRREALLPGPPGAPPKASSEALPGSPRLFVPSTGNESSPSEADSFFATSFPAPASTVISPAPTTPRLHPIPRANNSSMRNC